ncbi:competence protein CoiA-like family protein [mine drainage metagenome]|uniref:Competence protein CoiA-like family protein n=1 Tax=mine drainage metagenome TaxID=410659 RepID=A0A1J5SVK3_9ZZZZ
MENTSLLQLFATDKQNQIRSVDEVARGLACECRCPSCGKQVIARQGEVREWHFAHASISECDSGAETALHLAAKQLILQHQGISIPTRSVSETIRLKDGRNGVGEATRPELWLDFKDVEAEMSFRNIRPDIVASLENTYFFIEIAVTHFVDDAKKELFDELNIPTIEIDLASVRETKWTWPLLEEIVLTNTSHKKWLNMLHYPDLQKEASDIAMKNALNMAIPESTSNANVVNERNRFLINGRILDLIVKPSTLAIWSPYDPLLNEMIKPLIKKAGGRWYPKYKNWFVPLKAKTYLLTELEKLSGKPPKTMSNA